MDHPAFIWDLDGTLLDSYGVIVDGLYRTLHSFGVALGAEEIHREVIASSANDLLTRISSESGVPFERLKETCSKFTDVEKAKIGPMPFAADVLRSLSRAGARHFVFTHRGATSEFILKNTGLYGFFEEIVTGRNGFPRKPDPSAVNYLVEKYALDRENTYYVGDRAIDVECARAAGIKSILILPEQSAATATGGETYTVNSLSEIAGLFKEEA